jgi:predicted nucleotidyltransferase
MKMIDLKKKYLNIVRNILSQYAFNMIVWAYGSRVNGQSHEGSDLDLVISNPYDPLLPQENLNALRAAFNESELPIAVDILDWARLPLSFQNEIKKSYVILSTNPDKNET